MVVALLVNQFFPSSRGLERSKDKDSVEYDNGDPSFDPGYQELGEDDDDDDRLTISAKKSRAAQKRKPFRAMAALTSLASDFDVVSDWVFFYDACQEDREYRANYNAQRASKDDQQLLPYLIPPLLMYCVFSVCVVGTFMWLVLATDGRLVTPLVRWLGHDSLSMGHMLLLCVLLEDIPQIILTFLVEDYYQADTLSNVAICNLMTSLYDTLIKIAEAYDERHDIVETGDWCKESIWAHKDTVTSVLVVPLPPSAQQDSFRHLQSMRSMRKKLQKSSNPIAEQDHGALMPPVIQLPRLRFLTTSLDKTVRLWDTSASMKGHRREKCIRTFRGHMGGVTCVSLLGNPNNKKKVPRRTLEYCDEEADHTTYFVTGCQNGNAKLWNLAGVCIRSFYLPPLQETHHGERGITGITTLVEGSTFVCGYQDGTARLWEAFSGVCIGTYNGHDQSVTCIASMRNETFITGSMDGTIKLWDSTAAMAALREMHGASALDDSSRAPSPPSRMITKELSRFLMGGSCHEESTCVKSFSSRSNAAVLSVACVEPSRVFVSGSSDAIARVWSIDSQCCLRLLVDHVGPVSAILAIDKSTILTGSHDKTVKVWDTSSGICLRTYTEHEGHVTSVSIAEDNTTFLTSTEQMVKIWVVSSVPQQLPEQDTLDQILEANLASCRGCE